jgi:hypothetical protein
MNRRDSLSLEETYQTQLTIGGETFDPITWELQEQCQGPRSVRTSITMKSTRAVATMNASAR